VLSLGLGAASAFCHVQRERRREGLPSIAVDEELAERMRTALAGAGDMREVRMFGGLCFMLNGNMVAGTSKRGMLLRVGKEQHAAGGGECHRQCTRGRESSQISLHRIHLSGAADAFRRPDPFERVLVGGCRRRRVVRG
jgi:TfoX/Sxy family transcriptional regulator of competence genes